MSVVRSFFAPGGEFVAEKKRGRPRKYSTAGALRKGVDAYFGSISYQRDVIIRTQRIETDRKTGRPVVMETPEKLFGEDYKPIRETVYRVEPSVAGLCLFLHISRDTWAEYANDEKLGPVVEEVRTRMLARLEEQLNTRNSVQGVIFNLKANYGWSDKIELTQKNVGMSMEEYIGSLDREGKGQSF